MRFRIKLEAIDKERIIPANYQYPLSAAIYKIISKGDNDYATFLHQEGYGKGLKLFCFSDIKCPFVIEGDRLLLQQNELEVQVAFHLPEAMQHFVQGLFASEKINISDKKSRQDFRVKTIERINNKLSVYKENEIVSICVRPISPLVIGLKREDWSYEYLNPEHSRYQEMFVYSWREKIKAAYGEEEADNAFLAMEVKFYDKPYRSRLVTIKQGTPQQTKIKGYVNFKIEVKGERRFIDLLLNAGGGVYNAQGLGFLEIVEEKKNR
ncbi:CRISPR-associated endoribonuclease Cas6 [Myroides odoratimimus]|uniref:CRISPR-associated endoribonuclease Cas6 n=1 Tax=Myroides odoratimimus TaxID=76832 RepID=UPI0024BFB671|nr:CRISPR-associated endoribonuclease Cas6 [Myroides odoratimimus]WHT73338.1 CRISPR-associated endoribonuclease Cas6 [Myroides odoratimimus]WHU37920.1 CRISPR-associated endoribonuclease Cas6 [Myroides odoratimimus]